MPLKHHAQDNRASAPHVTGGQLADPAHAGPALVLRFVAVDDDSLDRIKGGFRRVLHSIEPSLDLAF